MVRVLNVISLECGGAESTVMSFYRNIDRSRVQFDFLVFDKDGKYYYEDETRSLGARIFRRPMRTRHPIQNTLVLYRALKENPDTKIIHIHNNISFSAADELLAKFFGVPVRIIHSRSALPDPSFAHRLFRPLLRAATNHWFACSTEAGISMLGKNAPKNRRFMLWPNARDLTLFIYDADKRAAARSGLGLEDKFVLLHTGRLCRPKNQGFLLEAFALAVNKNPNLVLVIAGDGELRKEVEQKAARLGLGDSLRLLGFRDDIPDLLQAADLYVMPSLYEGLPGAAIEAQAAGLPCLISDTVTPECKLIPEVEFLPIDQGPGIWTERMTAYPAYDRRNTLPEIRKAGYDIKEAAKRLENFYLKVAVG